jgi:hypothetical protein
MGWEKWDERDRVGRVKCRALRNSSVRNGTVQYGRVRFRTFSKVQYSAVHCIVQSRHVSIRTRYDAHRCTTGEFLLEVFGERREADAEYFQTTYMRHNLER